MLRQELIPSNRQHQSQRLAQEVELRSRFEQHAVRAFKMWTDRGRKFYTCNVERMKKLNRLGTRKQVSLWKSHFFLQGPMFKDVDAVIFSGTPGEDLSRFALDVVDDVYVLIGNGRIINPRTGEDFRPVEFPVFAPIDSPKDDPDIEFGDEYLPEPEEDIRDEAA